MQIEIFQGVAKPFVFQAISNDAQPTTNHDEFTELKTHVTLQDLRARIILCSKLKLKAQAHELLIHYYAYVLKSSIPYAFLSKQEERTLSRIFPTRYRHQIHDQISNSGPRNLTAYNRDFIPLAVLEAWYECQNKDLFSEYEIWTPERQQPDPILIGRRREHPFIYLIARWGEALRPWEELEKESRRW